MKRIIPIFLLCCLVSQIWAQTNILYTESSLDFPNPERGFYTPSMTYASNYDALSVSYLQSLRSLHTPWQANYQVQTTLIHRYFILDNFVGSAISTSFLANMQADFDAARMAGVKLILRYSYTNTAPTGTCGNWICPPYGDAPKSIVLQHIAQLEPFFEANKDIILAVQMGFIGVWGENYYTDYFGDASVSPFIITTTNWQERNEVLEALVDAVPVERTVQVRYPQLKQRLVYGVSAPTTSPALTAAEAYTGSQKARIGFHNDCFLASADDFGTYSDYGPPVSQSDTTNLKPYLANDTQFVPMGGETCSAYSPFDDCALQNGRADTEMRRLHFSYLNSGYNNLDVNNDWVGNCLDDIKKELGYRLVLLDGTYSNTVAAGQTFTVSLNLENKGYAAPFNRRGAELILRHLTTNDAYYAPLDVDPRFWQPGTHSISQNICLPPNIQQGTYELLLNLPDPEPTLFDNPLYSIRLANDNMWEASTGYNHLGHILAVNSNGMTSICNGDLTFTTLSVYDPAYCPQILHVNGMVATNQYVAGDQVLSNGMVNSNENVLYQSGNIINLNSDFEVKLGAEFLGYIRGCYEGN